MLKGTVILIGFALLGSGYEIAINGGHPGAILGLGVAGIVCVVGALLGDAGG